MDNITHSLFGAAVSETLWAALPEPTKRSFAPQTRKAFFLASVVGNNFPDLDFLYAPFMHSNPQLGNLLHHRGHTHTVPMALLQSLLLLGIVSLLQRTLKRFHFTVEWRWISILAFLAPLTHIALDFLNNYGVHPFWPFDNHWKYGDWLFVLEPWAWATLTPCLFLLAPTKKGKALYFLIGFLGLVLSWGLGVVPVLMCGVLTLWTLLLLGALTFLKDKGKIFLTWSALLALLLVFKAGQKSTEALVGKSPLTDTILSPLPVNPLCWAVVTVETTPTELHLKRAIAAPFPKILSLKTCTKLRFFSSELASATPDSQVLWETEHVVSLAELRSLKEQFCDVRDFLHFSRAPYFWKDETGLYFSDLRFERANRRSFARIKISSHSAP
ncbi:metal-dependent hydrolase, partial [bacterium]|nr:metal-dependent hydrolase [bacterium]